MDVKLISMGLTINEVTEPVPGFPGMSRVIRTEYFEESGEEITAEQFQLLLKREKAEDAELNGVHPAACDDPMCDNEECVLLSELMKAYEGKPHDITKTWFADRIAKYGYNADGVLSKLIDFIESKSEPQ